MESCSVESFSSLDDDAVDVVAKAHWTFETLNDSQQHAEPASHDIDKSGAAAGCRAVTLSVGEKLLSL